MNAAKKGLGRGLSALFGDIEVKSSTLDLWEDYLCLNLMYLT